MSVLRFRFAPFSATAPRARAWTVALLLAVLAMPALAQNADDGYAPDPDGAVFAVALQPDGKLLVGGDFTTIAGATRPRLVRLNVDGSLDAGFDPHVRNGAVRSIAVQPDGRILIGGTFTLVGTATRNRIARLAADGSFDEDFDPGADEAVYALAVQRDGRILAGGLFGTIAGQARASLARLNADGSLDAGFAPAPDAYVDRIALQADGRILVAGGFLAIDGQTRKHLARLGRSGDVDPAFRADIEDTAMGSGAYALAVQADGRILVGGTFFTIGGQTRYSLARLDRDGSVDDAFDPHAVGIVTALAIQPDGAILVGGDFSQIAGESRGRLARLDANGHLDPGFAPLADAAVSNLVVQGDGRVLASGGFTTVAGYPRNHLARLNRDGSVDATLTNPMATDPTGPKPAVPSLAVQPDGKLLVGGWFYGASGVTHRHLARLDADGVADSAFNASFNRYVYALAVQRDGKILVASEIGGVGVLTAYGVARVEANGGMDATFADPVIDSFAVHALAVQPDGKILVGGAFTSVGAQPRHGLARLNVDGSLDTSFADPGIDGDVLALALQADGKLLVGGTFQTVDGWSRRYLVRLDPDGGVDADFEDPAVSGGEVHALALLPDGRILVGGTFVRIGAQEGSTCMARLNANGRVDPTFEYSGANFSIEALAVQADGRILAGGAFTQIGGRTRKHLARLNPDGGLDAGFADPGFDFNIDALALQADGKLVVGGRFATVGAQPRNGLARLTLPEAAVQSLDANEDVVTWRRDGSAPELALPPVLYYSADGSAWTALGAMARVAGGWQRGGVPAPSGRWYYLRAEGRVVGGRHNASQGLVDSVRRVWRDDGIFADGFE